jgi:oligopeptide transport system permease protein
MAEISKEKFRVIGSNSGDADKILRPNLTYWNDAWRRLRKNKVAMLALFILIILMIMTVVGPYMVKNGYEVTDSSMLNKKPSSAHWFGTDSLGRDLFARIWIGGRASISIALIGALVVTTAGTIYGGIAGYFGGIVDDIMMRIVEVIVSIPYLIIVILVKLMFPPGVGGLTALIIAMTITGWTGMARMLRGQIMQLKGQEYVLAAKTLGASPARIIVRHLIPNTIGIMIVEITMAIPSFIFAEAFLSYIGLGVSSPQTSWGALASGAKQNLMFYPYQLFFPALMISLTMLSFNLLGDGLRDALDPRLRQ